MEAVFGFQDIMEAVKERIEELGLVATEAEMTAYKENKKKDYKGIYLIHQGCDDSNFDKI